MTNIMRFVILCLAISLTTSKVLRPGGRTEMDITNPETMSTLNNLTSYAVDQIAARRYTENRVSSILTPLKYSGRVISAESQIVAGVNYYIKIRMSDPTCTQQCSVEECNLIIWVRAWENFRNLTKFDCSLAKPDGGMLVGATNDLNLNLDDNSQAALDAVISRINQAITNTNNYHKIKNVMQAKRQIVAGNNYKFEFTIMETECKKTDDLNDGLQACKFKTDSAPLRCTASVLDKAWSRIRYSNMKFNCKNE